MSTPKGPEARAEQPEVLHGQGWTSDYYLCGQAPEAPVSERHDTIPRGRVAQAGERIVCPDCVTLIDHVISRFTSAHLVRR